MEQLISFLLYAALFYLVMRFFCGTHMIHGSHQNNSLRSVDPVCGMHLPRDKGCSEIFQGRVYRFCSRQCLLKFDDSPEKYLNSDGDRS